MVITFLFPTLPSFWVFSYLRTLAALGTQECSTLPLGTSLSSVVATSQQHSIRSDWSSPLRKLWMQLLVMKDTAHGGEEHPCDSLSKPWGLCRTLGFCNKAMWKFVYLLLLNYLTFACTFTALWSFNFFSAHHTHFASSVASVGW